MRLPSKLFAVCLIFLTAFSAVSLVYKFAPYQAMSQLIFDVYVRKEHGEAIYQNVTFSLKKFHPRMNDDVLTHKVRSLIGERPEIAMQMQLNMTLQLGEIYLTMPTKTITFSDEGQYRLIVTHWLDDLQTGMYLVTITFSTIFREDTLGWHSRELYLTVY